MTDSAEFSKKKWEKEKVKWKVDSSDFERIKKIAEGGQGDVFKCKQISKNREVVMKKTQAHLKNLDNQRYFNREVEILAKYHHPAIVPFIGYDELQIKKKVYGCIYLLMMEKGSLTSSIELNNKEGVKDPLWTNSSKFIITYGVACAMEYLHSNDIIHRDLKTDNILLDSKLRPYITDFGTAKNIVIGNSIHQTIQSTTLTIMAPEFLENYQTFKNNLKIDVYAFGITMFYLWTGIAPFSLYSTPYAITNAVLSGIRPEFPDETPENIADLIRRCWSQGPESRPTFSDIVDELLSDSFADQNQDKCFIEYKKELDEYRPNAKKPTSLSIEKKHSVGLTPKKDIPHTEPHKKKAHMPIKKSDDSASSNSSPVLQNLINDTKNGNFSSELELAFALYRGTYGKVDKKSALYHFSQVANKTKNKEDQKTAEYFCATILIEDNNYAQAERYLKRARDHGSADASFAQAELMSSKKIKCESSDVLYKLYETAAKKGDIVKIQAIRKVVSLLLNEKFDLTIANRKKIAYEFIEEGSLLGDQEMMHKYSQILEYGIGGVKQNIGEAKKLLDILKFRYIPSQIDYALHLLNGYHDFEKNPDLADNILEDASNKNDFNAMLYYSMILEKDSDREDDANSYFEKSRDSNKVPEAWSVYGQKLIQNEQYEDAVLPLFYGMEAGSIIAFLSFGTVCENCPEYGDPAFFFKCAAHRCHALDECGFYFPFNFNVYHCQTCNMDICEGCAKFCHKDHVTIHIRTEKGCDFKCSCGAKGFHNKCSAEYIAGCDLKCSGCDSLYQHLYQCETCCPNTENIYICKSCIENCHKGHKIVDCGIQKGVCGCGLSHIRNHFKCSLLKGVADVDKNECSAILNADDKIMQRWFQCFDCGLYGNDDVGVCQVCALNCHNEHRYIDLGFKKFNCTCFTKKCGFIE